MARNKPQKKITWQDFYVLEVRMPIHADVVESAHQIAGLKPHIDDLRAALPEGAVLTQGRERKAVGSVPLNATLQEAAE